MTLWRKGAGMTTSISLALLTITETHWQNTTIELPLAKHTLPVTATLQAERAKQRVKERIKSALKHLFSPGCKLFGHDTLSCSTFV